MEKKNLRKRFWFLGSLAVVFFFIYQFLYIFPSVGSLAAIRVHGLTEPARLILNQPDETVNYFFIRNLALHDQFGYVEPFTDFTDNQVHPRSTTVVRGAIVPIGFPGIIILYGFLLKIFVAIFGSTYFNVAAVALTPFVAAVTPLIFYGWVRRLWDERIALYAATLLYILPPWWYYASRPFQHNTLFVFFVVLFLYAVMKLREASNYKQWLWSVAIGLSFGLAVYVRPSEIVWLTILLLAIGYWLWIRPIRPAQGRQANHRLAIEKIRRVFILGSLAGLALIAVLFFWTQIAYYGAPFGSGYVKPLMNGASGSILSGPQGISFVKALLLPFGLHLHAILRTVYHYLLFLFISWTIAAGIGFCFLVRQRPAGFIRVYLISYLALCAYLILYYGSWFFSDNLAGAVSIGSSQVRYFLPLYVGALPMIAYFLTMIENWGKIGTRVAIIIALTLGLASAKAVLVPMEGLIAVNQTVQTYYGWRAGIMKLTPPHAIIITRYADKYLWPERKIIAGLTDADQLGAVAKLVAAGYPVYWYDLRNGGYSGGEHFSEPMERLATVQLRLSEPIASWEDLELRRVEKITEVR